MNQESTTEVGLADALGLDQDFEALASKARENIEAFVQEKPHAALGIAAAAGFVLGGGLTPRRLFKIVFAAGGPIMSRQLSSQVFRVLSDAMSSELPSNGEGSADASTVTDDQKPKRSRRPRAVSET